MNKPRRLLLFPQREYPSDHAMLEAVYTRLLPARGYQVRWIMHRGPSLPAAEHGEWNGTPVALLPPYPNRPGWAWPLTLAQQTRESYRLAQAIAKRQPPHLVQVRNEFADAYAALLLRRKWHSPFVYQFSFPTAEANLVHPTMNSNIPPRLRLINLAFQQTLRRWIMGHADLVLAISDRMRAELIAQGVPEERVISFPLGVDTDICPENYDRHAIRQELGLDNRPTVIYFGAMDRLRQLGFLLDMLIQVLQELPSAALLMVGAAGSLEEMEWLKAEVTRRGLDHAVRFIGRVPRAKVPFYLAAADLSVSPIPPLPIYTISSPTKTLESLGMARPVVANMEIHDQAQVITESGGGLCVPYEVRAFAQATLQLLQNPSQAQQRGRQGRTYVIQKRSYAKLADEIDGYYSRLFEAASLES